ncbi:MAG: SIS domain-containing protein [Pseudohongiellaceae bacterium]|nr:SIS domain-containing protein [Pseudohongiellaceae bacterium]
MDYEQRVAQQFNHSIATKQGAAANLSPDIVRASEALTSALLQGQKILCCGIAGSSALAQYFVSNLVNRYERERPGFPAIALNADNQLQSTLSYEYNFKQVLAKQIKVLGNEGDVLVLMCSSGSPRPIIEAIDEAHEKGMKVLALTGRDAEAIADTLGPADLEICVPVQSNARAQEVHLLVLHSLCELIDLQIFGEE